MHIVIDAPLPARRAEQLKQLSPRVSVQMGPRDGKPLTRALLAQAEVLYTESANFELADALKLRFVQTDSAATHGVRGKPVMKSNIPVCNVSGAYSVSVAECAMAMLLALTRRITLGVKFQLEHRWPEDHAPWAGVDLYGKTMGIAGYGSIGRQIARVASAMGMKILAAKRRPEMRRDDAWCAPGTGDPEGTIPIAWFGQNQISEMFRQSDVAIIALPETPQTGNLIGEKQLAALPKHAFLVNIGRGGVVDEAALARRLDAGELAGAALDVFAEEPLPSTSPLWRTPNTLIMPHIASWTDQQAQWATLVLIENVRRNLAGQPLINVVDKELLY